MRPRASGRCPRPPPKPRREAPALREGAREEGGLRGARSTCAPLRARHQRPQPRALTDTNGRGGKAPRAVTDTNGQGGKAPGARPAASAAPAPQLPPPGRRPPLPACRRRRRRAPFARAGSLSAAGGRAGALSLRQGEPHVKKSEGARRLHRRRRGEGTEGGGGRAGAP